MTNHIITAVFTGAEGSLGYSHGQPYKLKVWHAKATSPSPDWSLNTFVARVKDEESIDHESTVEYQSINAMLNNWNNITVVETIHLS